MAARARRKHICEICTHENDVRFVYISCTFGACTYDGHDMCENSAIFSTMDKKENQMREENVHEEKKQKRTTAFNVKLATTTHGHSTINSDDDVGNVHDDDDDNKKKSAQQNGQMQSRIYTHRKLYICTRHRINLGGWYTQYMRTSHSKAPKENLNIRVRVPSQRRMSIIYVDDGSYGI